MSRIEGVPLVKECEPFAFLEALSWASSLGFHNVIFDSDAKLMVVAVLSPSGDRSA